MQKQKIGNPGEEQSSKGSKDNTDALKAAETSKGLADRIEKALAKPQKKGHWEDCCGLRRWVND